MSKKIAYFVCIIIFVGIGSFAFINQQRLHSQEEIIQPRVVLDENEIISKIFEEEFKSQ